MWRTHRELIDQRETHLLEHARRHVGERDGLIALADVCHHKDETCNLEWIKGTRTFEHIFDKDAAFDNFLVGVELFVVRGDEEDHFCDEGLGERWKIRPVKTDSTYLYSQWLKPKFGVSAESACQVNACSYPAYTTSQRPHFQP